MVFAAKISHLLHFVAKIYHSHCSSIFPLVSEFVPCFFIEFSMVFIDLSMIFIDFSMVFFNFPWFSSIVPSIVPLFSSIVQWFSSMFLCFSSWRFVLTMLLLLLLLLCCVVPSFIPSFIPSFHSFLLSSFLPSFLTPSSHLPSTRKRENKNPKEIALHDQRLSARQPVENMPRRSGQPQRFYQGRHLLCLSLVLAWQTQISTRT